MIAVLSPAKNLNANPKSFPNHSIPRLLDESEVLIAKLKTYSKPKLEKLMGISTSLALLNQQRYQSFEKTHTLNNSSPSIFTFNGDVYQGLEPESLSDDQIEYANRHVRILSGLYGLLRPLDLMQPYRLEMGTSLPIRRKKNLYQFWGKQITELLNQDISEGGHDVIINLASDEYWKSIDESALKAPVVKVNFREWRKGQYRFLSYNAKRARGMMTRFIIENEIDQIEHLKGFDIDDYHFNDELSSEDSFIFTRE